MGVARYYWLVLRVAFSHSLSRAQDLIFLSIVALGFATWLSGRLGMTFNAAHWMQTVTSWQIAVGVLGAIIGIRLLLAPYWVWKEQREELARLRASPDAHTLALQDHTRAIDEQNVWQRRQSGPAWVALRKRAEDAAFNLAKSRATSVARQPLTIGLAERREYNSEEMLADDKVRNWIYIIIRNLTETAVSNIKVYQERSIDRESKGVGILPVLTEPLSVEPFGQLFVKIAYRDEQELDSFTGRRDGG